MLMRGIPDVYIQRRRALNRNNIIMAREVHLEETVDGQLSACAEANMGVLVGQLGEERDTVLFRVPTPCVEGSEGEDNGPLAEQWWVEDHAHQVWDLLPGGLAILGLYVVTSALTTSALGKLCSMLTSACQPNQVMRPYVPQPHALRALLHYSTDGQRLSCKYLDTNNTRAGLRVAVVRVGPQADCWHQLTCCVPVHTEVCMPTIADSFSTAVQEHLLKALSPLQAGVVVEEGRCWGKEDKVEGRKEEEERDEGAVLWPVHKPTSEGSSVLISRAVAVQLSGRVAAIACAPASTSLAQAARRLGEDVLRSVSVRWTRLCEDCPDLQQTIAQPQACQWRLPHRILVTVAGLGPRMKLCAYQYQDESKEELRERVAEILSVSSTEITMRDWEKEPVIATHYKHSSPQHSRSMPGLQLVLLATAIIFAVLAILVWAVQ